MPSRRDVLLGLAGLPLAAHAIDTTDSLHAILDAVGPLESGVFNPARALDAMQALAALGAGAEAALRDYIAQRQAPPSGLFIVVRCLVELPPATAPEPEWPGVLQPGRLRPPALGAPHPDTDQHFERFPAMLMEDVPLSLVSGYILGGEPESLSMHLDGLAGATWRATPFAPKPASGVWKTLIHWGRWPSDTTLGQDLRAQLDRLQQDQN